MERLWKVISKLREYLLSMSYSAVMDMGKTQNPPTKGRTRKKEGNGVSKGGLNAAFEATSSKMRPAEGGVTLGKPFPLIPLS